MQLRGSLIVVTGAGRGIGAASVRALSVRGAHVVGVGRSDAPDDWPAEAQWVRADLREPTSGAQVIAETLARYGRVDAVVANAGLGHVGPMAEIAPERLAELVTVNVTAPLLMTRAVLPSMLAAGRGNLLFLSSIAGAVGVPGETVYSTTKAALEAFADTLRSEVRGRGITVATLLPGVVDTDFHAARTTPYTRRFPRPLRAEAVAAAIVDMLEHDVRRRFQPRWLAAPAAIRAVAPRLYRSLERRFD